ncbi:MAG: hypothetical protein V4696_01670 [Pseudomonadota bacterium]
MQRDSVLYENDPIAQVRYHAALLAGLEAGKRQLGEAGLREALDLSRTGLSNLLSGVSAPKEKRLWDLRAKVPDALDALADLYGARIVPKGSVCDTDQKAAPALVAALHKVIEAEADGNIDHVELLGMEREIIAAEHAIQLIRSRITELRTPRAVSL